MVERLPEFPSVVIQASQRMVRLGKLRLQFEREMIVLNGPLTVTDLMIARPHVLEDLRSQISILGIRLNRKGSLVLCYRFEFISKGCVPITN